MRIIFGRPARPPSLPPDHGDAARDVARELAEAASLLAGIKGEAMIWLDDANYSALKLRLENAHAAVEARRRVRLNEGDGRGSRR